jgi:DNA processing protein
MHDKLLWLQIARSVGPISFHSIKQKYCNPKDALQYLINNNKKIIPEEEIREEAYKIGQYGANLIFIDDPEYPQLLKLIRDAPPFLIVKGKFNPAARFISIIGSRNSSINANKIAFNLAEKLVECGISIVSGMARGIDRHAHLGGIKDTIAVLGCGVDYIYPQENLSLYHDIILNGGAIISEARIGTHPAPNLFRARNRIIAGMSLGSVIVQGTQYSGSLLTAQYAADYNREVFAVPGCPLDPRSYGPNNLIKNGAALVQDHNDILRELLHEVPKPETIIPEEDYIHDESLRDRVLSYLSSVPTSIDDLQTHLSVPIHVIRETLVQLDLDELIKHAPGDRVIRLYN